MTLRLTILDPGLKDFVGHYYDYDRSIAEAAAKLDIECTVFAHADFVRTAKDLLDIRPLYRADIWSRIADCPFHEEANLRAVSKSFAADTATFLAERPLHRTDIVFVPNIGKAQLLGVATLAEMIGPSGASLHLMFRYPRPFYESAVVGESFRRLEAAQKIGAVRLCTDSHRLAKELRCFTALDFDVVPIPQSCEIAERPRPKFKADQPLHVVVLGNARGEKGIEDIMTAIAQTRRVAWGRNLRFTLQVNDPSPDIAKAIKAFRQTTDPRVTFIDRALDTDAYKAVLESADIVLVPYHRSVYRSRSSGVMLEAIIAGKIVVCTSDTWMSDVLAIQGSGLAIPDRSPRRIVRALATIMQGKDAFMTRAEEAARYWNAIQSGSNFIRNLLDDRSQQSIPVPLKPVGGLANTCHKIMAAWKSSCR